MAFLSGRLLRLGLLVVLLLALVIVPFALWGDAIEAWTARHALSGSSSAPVALAGGALLTADILLPIPSSMVGMVLGASLGVVDATLVGAVGLTLGCGVGYVIGRRSDRQ